MAKLSKRRQLTGCVRRGPKRNHSSYRRAMHLSHAEVGYRALLQCCMVKSGNVARSALLTLSPLIILSILVNGTNLINPTIPNAVLACNCILRLQHLKYTVSQGRFARWFILDHKYHDIPLEEEEASRPTRMPRQDIRFDSWTDQECYDFTSFKKHQLLRIYTQFGFRELAEQGRGYIRVPQLEYGAVIPVPLPPTITFYKFHPEELFLFLMTKCKTGLSNKVMCDLIFGGHASRWSYGWPWVLSYLDDRYENVIGHQMLSKFVDQFPRFYEAIQKCVQHTTTHHFTDYTAEDRTGLNFLPFSIFAFIDCSIDKVCRPYSGPDGDYIGAPRREEYYDAQESVYTGYKKYHGIKVETVLLPNGISTLYGPVSARPHDVAGVLQMSGLDEFLYDIQQDEEYVYSALGDGIYGQTGLRCVRSYFRAPPGAQLTDEQQICNDRIKPCRQAIEWSYADVEDIFQLCSNERNYKLGKRVPYAQEQLRVCHLLSNIYVCLNGSKTTSYRKFNLLPPKLEDYLRLD